MEKAYGIIQMILALQKSGKNLLAKGGSIQDFLSAADTLEKIGRARFVPENEFEAYKKEFINTVDNVFTVKA
jgi:V/A-type H+-transporting ATPase subunit A